MTTNPKTLKISVTEQLNTYISDVHVFPKHTTKDGVRDNMERLTRWTWYYWDTKQDEIKSLYKRMGFNTVQLIPTSEGDAITAHDGRGLYMVGIVKQ